MYSVSIVLSFPIDRAMKIVSNGEDLSEVFGKLKHGCITPHIYYFS